MNTTIHLKDIKLQAIIGTKPEERDRKQDIVLNIALTYDASQAIKTDDLHDALDYERLMQKIAGLVESSRFFLLEKLASAILTVNMQDDRVLAANIRVDKPQALSHFAQSVGIELSQTRKN